MTAVDTRGVHGSAADRITVGDMVEKAKLLTIDQVREALSTTEPVSSVGFPVGDGVRFQVKPAWNHGIEGKAGTDLVEAYVKIGRGQGSQEFQLSKDALLEATSICGLPKGYVVRTPSALIEPQLNYWFREGLNGKDYKLLTVGRDSHGAAFTRSTIVPFSNIRLLDQAIEGVQAKYGDGPLYADYKLSHSLVRTHVRLIIPEEMRVMDRTGTDDDTWSVGIQMKNSLIGNEQTELNGYLFRWWCTNGAIDQMATSGTWSRRSGGQGDEVYQWAREAVDDVLGGLEHSLDNVQSLVDVPIAEDDDPNEILRDIFTQYRIPGPDRERIIENMVANDQMNMYAVMQAITQAANAPGLDPGHVETLMNAGGDLPTAAHERCDSCRRLMPH